MPSFTVLTYKYSILACLWVDYFWEQYLCYRQYKITRHFNDLPPQLQDAVSKKTFEKARRYMLERKGLSFFKDFIYITISTIIIVYELLPEFWNFTKSIHELDDSEVVDNCLWYLLYSNLLTIINLPLTIYQIVVVEANYNTKKKIEVLLWNKFKQFFWGQLFGTVAAGLLVKIVVNGDQVMIGLWMIVLSLVFVIGVTYPLIAPSKFRRLTQLKPCDLRTDIIKLASHVKLPLREIYVEEKFKRTTCNSVYIFGPPNQKSIVVSDSLLLDEQYGCSNEEILALVSLELGRWHYQHGIKYVLILEINLLLSFITFFFLFKNENVIRVFGFNDHRPVLLVVFVCIKYVMALYNSVLGFCFLYASHRFVKESDQFVTSVGKGKALASALVKFEKNNFTFPVYDAWYSVWHHDKPSLFERLRAIAEKVE